MMLKHCILMLLSCLFALAGRADGGRMEDIRRALEEASSRQVQEKVFLHTDNMCYFVGDTIWYKAYVVRADDLRYTDMSRVLYVELLTPDGLLVERQRVIVSDRGFGCGQFCLQDSLYSGYYEMRAYTRWMLNFNVSLQRYSRDDSYLFYSADMARDYFRRWDGLYSRVLPIYSRPDTPGDYTYKRMYGRPKQNVQKAAKRELHAAFFPEGGHLVEGVPCRVAFELTDQDGAAVSLAGRVTDGGRDVAEARTGHLGRGVFTVTPGKTRLRGEFRWRGEDYAFDLPKAEASGVALSLDNGRVRLAARGMPEGEYGLSVLCRGVLQDFRSVTFGADGSAEIELPAMLPTGVNDVTLFTADGRIVADRLFFVNGHDYDTGRTVVESGAKVQYDPYEEVSLQLACGGVTEPTLVSVAVRDACTDEETYDDGDIRTELLLSSELKGFIASPAYYFAADDDEHRQALDLLMMVQGWRRYDWRELSDTLFMERRYAPEKSLTVEGGVYKTPDLTLVEPEEIASWARGRGMIGMKTEEAAAADPFATASDTDDDGTGGTDITADAKADFASSIEYGSLGTANDQIGVNHGGLKKEVVVEAAVVFSDGIVGGKQLTYNGGRYFIDIPPFYGTAILKLTAYEEKDSLKKAMASHADVDVSKEDAYPDFYVKRDMFYPVFAAKYGYYQTHCPEIRTSLDLGRPDSLSSMETEDHLLRNLDVKGKKRGRRAIDYTKPAYVMDAYDLYNDITDYGLSFGMYDMRQFPVQIARYLYGNMGRYKRYNIAGRIDRYTYYRTFNPDGNLGSAASGMSTMMDNRNPRAFYEKLRLKSLHQIRVYTDYEPRNSDVELEMSRTTADVTVEMVPFKDGGVQYTFRDRHIVLKGFNEAAAFYNPDYSNRNPKAPADYRRTLYWNPNAVTDSEGRLTAKFYNNGKETRIKVSVAGITKEGKFVY